MNMLQIKRILKNDPYAKKVFKAIYPKDLLSTVECPGSYALNTNPNSSSGEYWVAMFFNNEGSAEVFFDTYSIYPIVQQIFWILIPHHRSTIQRPYRV